MLARSHGVCDGYWELPEAAASTFTDDWFCIGDSGRLGPDGYLTITDRKKDIIITGGENVSATEVENRLLSHPPGFQARGRAPVRGRSTLTRSE